MGGRIWLESVAGAGTTFFCTVWIGAGTARGSGKIIPERLTHLRVLVVDDNPAAREILQEPLSNIVSRVDAVGSAKDALAAIKEQDPTAPYDIVFMDWRMPGTDGLQASRHIKSDETLRHQPAIVLVTAFGREEVRDEAEHLQLDGFLLKPVTKSMIIDTLVNIFAGTEERGLAGRRKEDEAAGLLAGARILLVEDNEINQQIAVELLQSAGATVKVANNGKEAVQTLETGPQPPPFDVVLMDLQMPVMDGYQATAKLRSDPSFRSLPIIAMTAHATIEERQRCLGAGMNDHISKPIDPAALFETVHRYYRPAVEPAAPPPASAPSSSAPVPATPAATPPPASPAGDPADLPAVEGLNTAEGLLRVAGNRKLYVKLLRQFVEQQGSTVDQVTAALGQGDPALAERLAHTLKGVAGNIGAKSVQASAGALEKLIRVRADSAAVDSGKTELAAVLTPLVAALGNSLTPFEPASAPPTPPGRAVDPAVARAAATQLAKLLADSDPGAAEFTEANRVALGSLFASDAWADFEKLVQNYGFAEAQARLEQAIKTTL